MKRVICDINAAKRRANKTYELSKEQENSLYPLKDYIKIAKQTIGYFAGNGLAHQMLSDEDAISFVTERLIDAHCRWSEDGGRTLRSWLNQCAIFALQRYVNIQSSNKKPLKSLDSQVFKDGKTTLADMIDSKTLEPYEEAFDSPSIRQSEVRCQAKDIINSGILTERQKECMSLHFLDGFSVTEIAKKLNVSRQAVDQNIDKGIKKLQKKYV